MSVENVLVKRVSSDFRSIDDKLLRTYLLLGARDADLSDMLGVSISTLRRMFGDTLKKLRAERRTHIRRMIWEKVKDGNVPLLLWLAKHELEAAEESSHSAVPRKRKQFDYQKFIDEFRKAHDLDRNVGGQPAEADDSGQPVHSSDADAEASRVPHTARG